MADKKNTDRGFDACFENNPLAELMQKMMGRQRVGSLSAEMMKKILESQKDRCCLNWAEIMQGIKTQSGRVEEEPEKNKEEVCDERKES
jgi:hypothetical protein